MIPSLTHITAIPTKFDGGVQVLVDLPGTDFEAVTVVGDRVFAISEGEVSSQLIELKWTGGPAVDSSGTAVKSSGEGLDWQLRVLQKWTLQGLVRH